ncbi:MAG: YkgJ family cysteine cluster protein [Nitrospirae bacterium]|nr:MAG: YkgJ family cysteine cluster protein [Nitrospirota bacterium]
MTPNHSSETYHVAIQTPVGEVQAEVSVPTSFIPLSSLVSPMRALGEQALALEQQRVESTGLSISCHKGCAACCRMLVPVSPPEAFTLHRTVQALPEPQRTAIQDRFRQTQHILEETGLLGQLVQLAETRTQWSDEQMDPLNRAYYALRLPCPFLDDNELCSIYHDRPAACRELLVTSPPEWCQDVTCHPVRPLQVHVRAGTVLSLLWAELDHGPARLIPLPVALDWAERHQSELRSQWTGRELLDKALTHLSRFLSQHHSSPPASSPFPPTR